MEQLTVPKLHTCDRCRFPGSEGCTHPPEKIRRSPKSPYIWCADCGAVGYAEDVQVQS